MEIFCQITGILPFIGNQSPNTEDFSKKQRIFLRKLHTAHIPFVFHGVIHKTPPVLSITSIRNLHNFFKYSHSLQIQKSSVK